MNRSEFIKELSFLLQDVDDVERQEALQYYEDYFDEAGQENEQQIINDLGSPERVAAIIKAGLNNQFEQDIEYTENGMDNSNYKQSKEIIDAKIVNEKVHGNNEKKSIFQGNRERNLILLGLIIIGVLFLALPIGGGIFGLGLGFIGSVCTVSLVVLFGGLICLIGAIAVFVKATTIMALYPGTGLLMLAFGFVLISLMIIFFRFSKAIIKIIPQVFRMIVDLIQRIIGRVGER